jgi:hypothetical protein
MECDYEKRAIALEHLLAKKMLSMDRREAIDVAWEYYFSAPFTWYGHSSKLNIKTELEILHDDINGFTEGTILHYTHNRDIYGTSTDLDEFGIPYGEQPIFYMGCFEINNHDFELSFEALEIGEIQFIPKKEAAFNTY